MKLADERLRIACLTDLDSLLCVEASAGTGKTSTLILMGAATRKRGLYVAFNRAIADEIRPLP